MRIDSHWADRTEDIINECLFDGNDAVGEIGWQVKHMAPGHFDFPTLFTKEPFDSPGDNDRHLFAGMAVDFNFAAGMEQDFGNIHMLAGKAVSVESGHWLVEWDF